MALTLKQIRLLTPGQTLETRCDTINGWSTACRTAYNGRKEILTAGTFDCEVSQDSASQTISVSVKAKIGGGDDDKHLP